MSEYNPFSLHGKRILITGASSGIGRACAIECSKMGAELIVTGRNKERLGSTISMLSGSNHSYWEMDLTDSDQVSEFIEGIDKLDGVVYCAGTQKSLPVKFIDRESADEVFNINFFSVAHFNTFLLKNKKIQRGASLVFVSSIAAGLVAEYGNAIYSASKGALSAFARVLALETSAQKIRVNCLLPGMVETPLMEKFSVDEEEFKKNALSYPLGYGHPQDVALAAIYFLSDASKWVTGSSLVMDGGLTLK